MQTTINPDGSIVIEFPSKHCGKFLSVIMSEGKAHIFMSEHTTIGYNLELQDKAAWSLPIKPKQEQTHEEKSNKKGK